MKIEFKNVEGREYYDHQITHEIIINGDAEFPFQLLSLANESMWVLRSPADDMIPLTDALDLESAKEAAIEEIKVWG